MSVRHLDRPGPIKAVLFDFHSTLVDQGDPKAWLDLAWIHAGRRGTAVEGLGRQRHEELARWLNHVWEHVVEVDPRNERDLSPVRHREVYGALMERVPGGAEDLEQALYEVMLEVWIPYDDAVPTLKGLKARGLRTALVSNVGADIRPVLERAGLASLFDAVILSYEVGSVKPAAAIFERALAALDVAPANALMVGDNWTDDSGAARLGVRTLLLPRTAGVTHGLEVVLRLVGP
jgi:HAD superfamily hydrolase (TIGR01509 family)